MNVGMTPVSSQNEGFIIHLGHRQVPSRTLSASAPLALPAKNLLRLSRETLYQP